MRGPSNYYDCLKHNRRWTKTISRATMNGKWGTNYNGISKNKGGLLQELKAKENELFTEYNTLRRTSCLRDPKRFRTHVSNNGGHG